MSGLRVTDVQAALRHFQELGHDVLTNPRALLLKAQPSDEKPTEYGLAVGHKLNIHSPGRSVVNDFSHSPYSLHSFIMQSERPLISAVRSDFLIYPKKGTEAHNRDVVPLRPHTINFHPDDFENAENEPSHVYGEHDWNSPGFMGTTSVSQPMGSPVTFRSRNDVDYHKDIHEALESHRSSDVPHVGKIWTPQGTKRDMHEDDLRNFKHREALSNLVFPVEPFKNLIAVNDTFDGSMYSYNPETEQLLKAF